LNDPHVVSLTYRIQHSETVDFDKAAPLPLVDRGVFRISIDSYEAKIEMIDHFVSVEEARQVVEPYLSAWELQADLAHWAERFRFVFDRAHVIDQSPREGEPVQVSVGEAVVAGDVVVAHVSRSRWPAPPHDLELSADAETMWHRWLLYRGQREPLLSAAYWALTMLEGAPAAAVRSRPGHISKKRQRACDFFNIDPDVLNKLGELTSTKGGDNEARKAEGRPVPLSPAERRWVEAAFRELVRRVAQRAHYGAQPPHKLMMADLPPLP
jgi:hypothetical protein